jgi:pimeloyl-ACP methyl ester carboxylesterase
MATFVFVHGAGSDSGDWRPVTPKLRGRGHDVVAPDLPCEDESAGLAEYAETVVKAIGDRTDLVVVGHSLGGFTAPLVCDRMPVRLLVMLQAMIPAPGETFGDWWTNTGYSEARRHNDERHGGPPADDVALFLHDTPSELVADAQARERDQAEAPLAQPWPLPAWPDVPTKVLVTRDDRCFPVEFMRRVAKDRLGVTADEMPGDHMPMLGHPADLADRLAAYWAEQSGRP